jgi:steroid 5-alpha reductase family enzyme
MIILWSISVIIKNVSIVDVFWGLGFVIVNGIYFYLSENFQLRSIIVLLLVSIWGLRLSIYLGLRNIGKSEDFRYQEFRRKYGAHRYWWFSFFQVFLLQGALIMIISLPLLGIHYFSENKDLSILDYMGITLWLIGFIFESLGDYQLAKFKKDPRNNNKVLNTGLWKYTRHPNYFGDTVVWWAYAIFCISAGAYWPILGSVIMTFLIIKVSGVALLEEDISDRRPEYKMYIDKTSSFFPWFPKK